METKRVIEFYDELVKEQVKSGINERIYNLYRRLLRLGLNAHSTVLELGSGIGALTFLLSRKIKTGKIEAVDISPESILFSRQRIKNRNVSLVAGDIVDYVPTTQHIDYITLFDVLEHIPLDRHDQLFKHLSAICSDSTRIVINIPNPEYIEYDIRNNSTALQIIDQPVRLNVILENLENNGLNLVYFETYSVWVENDYQFIVATKKRPFKEVKLQRTYLQKAIRKGKRSYVKLKYNYR